MVPSGCFNYHNFSDLLIALPANLLQARDFRFAQQNCCNYAGSLQKINKLAAEFHLKMRNERHVTMRAIEGEQERARSGNQDKINYFPITCHRE